MKDDFLTKLREAPRAEFDRRLYERINEPMQTNQPVNQFSLRRWSPVLIGLGALFLVVLVLAYPPVQAAAQGFLDSFRVHRFSAITIDPARLEQIKNTNIDFETLLSNDVRRIKDPGQPQVVANVAAASSAAGFAVRAPGKVPAGATLHEIRVQGEAIAEVTADTGKLQSLLDALQINDVKIPPQLNGAKITVRKPAMVVMSYDAPRDPLTFIQALSPDINLPDGVSLSDLNVIALRIAGLSLNDAQAYAKKVDLRSTILVPVPANTASVREVAIHTAGGDVTGMLITTGGTGASSVRPESGARQRSVLLWSDGNMVFGLQGGPVSPDLIDFANSLH